MKPRLKSDFLLAMVMRYFFFQNCRLWRAAVATLGDKFLGFVAENSTH